MDNIDTKIINMLIDNSRISVSTIAQKINMSISAVAERIRKLEKTQVIRQYTAIIDEEQFGLNTMALVSVNVEHPKYFENFSQYVRKQNAIVECYYCAGDIDYILKLKTTTTHELETRLSEIRSVPGVGRIKTMLVLSIPKEGYTPKIEDMDFNNQ